MNAARFEEIARNPEEAQKVREDLRQRFIQLLQAEANYNLDEWTAKTQPLSDRFFFVDAACLIHGVEGWDEHDREVALQELLRMMTEDLNRNGWRSHESVYKNSAAQWLTYRASFLVGEDRKGRAARIRRRKLEERIHAQGHEPCSQCRGEGRIEYFKHIDQGICYRCGGTGIEPHS